MSSLRTNAIQHEETTPIDKLKELRWSLLTVPSVEEVELTHRDVDIEGDLVIHTTSEIVEPAIEDTIQNYDGWMKPPEVRDDIVKISVKVDGVPDPDFTESGRNNIRKRGGSHILAIPPDAIEASGIELGDNVEFYSREGEILFTNTED